ncbi:SIMPL domain-containing protein [Anaeromicrobium sediminis]|uniref:SIMPL domain-containing protein n=1 Tax=Anaeromicrobium sediminis TaxID=1478221 RepID=A0A267MDI9_9FIRM|nr:SIMPL domain-containing protein [Anaeromicrobium sediminis]PAB57651.1 SIMPL domain-containing protein [Anaeromicrobium sediminis]
MNNKNPLIIVALILTLGVIVSSVIVTKGFVQVKANKNSLTVKGSAKKQIKSDFVVWNGSFSVQSSDLSSAYSKIKEDELKVKNYLINAGIKEDDIVLSSISTSTYNKILPNGTYTNEIESYKLYQTVEIRSSDVDKITNISREATDLINSGVEFSSNGPQYFYTKLADLKIEMIELATKDAKLRAEKLLQISNNTPGQLLSARVGVFQITPLYSNEISDYGINDTSSLEKEITAVVSCEFEVK